jgi:hypothetical protein
MELIRHVEDATLSLFQSAVEGVVKRRNGSDARPSIEEPMVLAAALYAEMKHKGQPVPDQAPSELRAQAGDAAGPRPGAASVFPAIFCSRGSREIRRTPRSSRAS